jgi:hypothetical protein
MYDLVDPAKVPPAACLPNGCARWTHLVEDGAILPPMQNQWLHSKFTDNKEYPSNQSSINAQWSAGAPPAGVGRLCANPAKTSLVAWPPYPREAPGTDTAFCFCANATKADPTTWWGDCRSAPSVPEQINVVLGQENSVVVAFVTLWEPLFGADLAKRTTPLPPKAEYSYSAAGQQHNLTAVGITHLYQSPQNLTDPNANRYWNLSARNYSFHFIKLTDLPEGVAVSYRVSSGAAADSAKGFNAISNDSVAAATSWSERFSFNAPFGSTHQARGRSGPGETIVDLFGDMGVYGWNNMANMETDLQQGTTS